MANPQLSEAERKKHFAPLFESIKKKISLLAEKNPRLSWALQRKLWRELSYLERGTPQQRRKLKIEKWHAQNKKCAVKSCGKKKNIRLKYSVLDRRKAIGGYTSQNTRLLCRSCDIKIQKQKGYR